MAVPRTPGSNHGGTHDLTTDNVAKIVIVMIEIGHAPMIKRMIVAANKIFLIVSIVIPSF